MLQKFFPSGEESNSELYPVRERKKRDNESCNTRYVISAKNCVAYISVVVCM